MLCVAKGSREFPFFYEPFAALYPGLWMLRVAQTLDVRSTVEDELGAAEPGTKPRPENKAIWNRTLGNSSGKADGLESSKVKTRPSRNEKAG